MTALKLKAAPTFFGVVTIPGPSEDLKLKFEFKHRTRSETQGFANSMKDRDEVENILEIARGWDATDEAGVAIPFDKNTIGEFIEQYHQAAFAIGQRYFDQLREGKRGN